MVFIIIVKVVCCSFEENYYDFEIVTDKVDFKSYSLVATRHNLVESNLLMVECWKTNWWLYLNFMRGILVYLKKFYCLN